MRGRKKTFRLRPIPRQAYELYRRHFFIIFPCYLVLAIISLLNKIIIPHFSTRFTVTLVDIAISFISFIIALTLYMYLEHTDNDSSISIAKSTLFTVKRLPIILLTMVILTVVIFAGLIAFIIPGIYFFLKYSQTIFPVLLREMGIKEALQLSAKVTKGVRLKLFLFYVIVEFTVLIITVLVSVFIRPIAREILILFPGSFTPILFFITWKMLAQRNSA